MASFNYNHPYGPNPPQYPTPQNNIYPPLPTGQQPLGYPTAPGQNPHYPYQPGFSYPYPNQPGNPPAPGQPSQQPNVHPSAMSYPSAPPQINPTPAYGFGYPTQPTVTPGAPSSQPSRPQVEWIPTTPRQATSLADHCIVAGYEGHDGSPLWVIRARYEGDLVPGKLAIKHFAAFVPFGGDEKSVSNIEVCCARPEIVRWVEAKDGQVPVNAIQGGHTASGEPLYIGRAKYQGSLTPGKVHPSHKVMYMSFAGKETPFKNYEVLCTA